MDVGLYDYQIDAIKRLHNGSILCADVGVGKSRTAIGYYFTECGGSVQPYQEMTHPRDLYIITTAQKRDKMEWQGDMAPYLLSIHPEFCHYKINIVVDSWNNIKKYEKVYGAFFIFDEQRLVGSGAWVKAFYKIARKNKWILLTATPGDEWKDYIPVFVANGFYRNKSEFNDMHVVWKPYSKYPCILKYINVGRLIKYRNQILVKMVGDKKNTVRHSETIIAEYDKTKYKAIFKDRWNIYENKPIENISECCYLLRKLVNSDESRVFSLLELTVDHPKAIIFYNFDYELKILKNIPYMEGTQIGEWNGHAHEAIPKSERWVYLVQYTAGSEGWNCTLSDTIIFYSQNYSYRTTYQAMGRIDRLNTPFKDLYYYTIRSLAPIDSSIAVALKRKQNFNESMFMGK